MSFMESCSTAVGGFHKTRTKLGRMNSTEPKWLSTGQAAKLCSVTPATVLNWIRKGRLEGVRTAGGHYRIRREQLEPLLTDTWSTSKTISLSTPRRPQPLRCWEYFSYDGMTRPECTHCDVFRVRAAWCFEFAAMGTEAGSGGPLCPTTCKECAYYRRAVGKPTEVLVVTSDQDLVRDLKEPACDAISLRFARNAYEASMVVQTALPAFAVVDRETVSGGGEGLVEGLVHDARLPGLKIVVAVAHGDEQMLVGDDDWRFVVRVLEKPFGVNRIAEIIDGFPVEEIDPELVAGMSQPATRGRTMLQQEGTAVEHGQDDDGFLNAMADWNPAMAETLGKVHGIGELTHEHWRVIEFVQNYYKTYGTGPPVIQVHKETGLSSSDICRLFPCGMVKGAYRLAGLPRPPGCAG
jgi:TusE/DsrC/DsvC family sulfur relay protein